MTEHIVVATIVLILSITATAVAELHHSLIPKVISSPKQKKKSTPHQLMPIKKLFLANYYTAVSHLLRGIAQRQYYSTMFSPNKNQEKNAMFQPSIRILSLETPHSFFCESHSFCKKINLILLSITTEQIFRFTQYHCITTQYTLLLTSFIESIYKTQKIDFIRI